MDKKKLLKRIEELRKEMYKITENKGRENNEVIKKSQELDELLLEYQKLIKKD